MSVHLRKASGKMEEDIPYHATNSNIAFWCSFSHQYIIDNYEEDTLPLIGWIKQCNICRLVSGHHVDYEYKGAPVHIPLCRQCSKRFHKKNLMSYICEDICSKLRYTLREY